MTIGNKLETEIGNTYWKDICETENLQINLRLHWMHCIALDGQNKLETEFMQINWKDIHMRNRNWMVNIKLLQCFELQMLLLVALQCIESMIAIQSDCYVTVALG